jgi:hypothetical protein
MWPFEMRLGQRAAKVQAARRSARDSLSIDWLSSAVLPLAPPFNRGLQIALSLCVFVEKSVKTTRSDPPKCN